MKREMVLLPALIGGLLTMTAAPFHANSFCADRAEMVKSLADKFKENPAAVGMIDRQRGDRGLCVRERKLDDPRHRHRRQELRALGRRRLGDQCRRAWRRRLIEAKPSLDCP